MSVFSKNYKEFCECMINVCLLISPPGESTYLNGE